MLKRITVVVFLLVAGLAQAQEGTVSPYSFYGIGTLKFKGTAENRAMGGISVYADSIHLSIQNPAGVAGLRLVNYSAGVSHKYETIKTEVESQKASTTSIDYLALGIPMGKFGASFGLIPLTSVGYNLRTQDAGITTTYQGSGGLNKAFFALAYQLTPKLSIGVDANYNFGNIENTAERREDNIQYGTSEFNKSDLLGFNFNIGAIYKTMINESLSLISSLTYTPETDLTSENTRVISTFLVLPSGAISARDERDINVGDTEFTFPSQYTVGLGIGKEKKWFIGGEYTNLKTSNLTNRSFDIDFVTFTDSSKFRVGGFYIPNYNAIGKYWNRVVYRGGVRFEETGININGEGINEFGISFGVGLPVGRLFSNINLGFEIGRRGTTDFGLVQENFFNTFISLSLNDRWFEKRYYD
ncbi:MAG: outer membrane protein transport protein [Bacteroidia bacterium]|nr:outer membrane protein transport protein [Bacteroidia bacterium]NNF32192.1 hypothetical protein [Flavobacteriaceae bacterium]MBT8276655.1 outer membrane protein transport protein [Bacteroidia bacterium]NNJ82875.1 hypothetical protein [Flavobacteriaceae bacterium]NNK55113.1 hypothetical protein [Flavobacteriaceae bacterium]